MGFLVEMNIRNSWQQLCKPKHWSNQDKNRQQFRQILIIIIIQHLRKKKLNMRANVKFLMSGAARMVSSCLRSSTQPTLLEVCSESKPLLLSSTVKVLWVSHIRCFWRWMEHRDTPFWGRFSVRTPLCSLRRRKVTGSNSLSLYS